MKNIFAVMAIALIVLASCGDKKKEVKETTPVKVQEMKTGRLKIAFYNQDSLKAQFKYYTDQDKYITSKQLAFKGEMDRLSKEYQEFVQRNEQKAQQGLLSQLQMQEIAQQVQAKERKIMQYEQSQGKKIEEETMKSLESIGKKIESYSKDFAEKNKIDILLIQAAGGQFGYIVPQMDVTKEFIEFLNAHEEEIEKDMGKK